jgi:3-hydroxybutyryl-CoA dehydratase
MEAVDRSFAELVEGLSAESDYRISRQAYDHFCALSGDLNPLHVDDEHARRAGFAGRVVHGALLNAFLSHFVGMVLPGRRSLLLSADTRYLAPSHLEDTIVVKGTVRQRVESHGVVVVDCVLENRTRGLVVARARVQVKVQDG